MTQTPAMSRIPEAGIYAIENTVNGRIYVGSATDLGRRMAKHDAEIRSGYHYSTQLRGDIEQYGPDAFRIVILQRVYDLTELEYLEHVWMRRLGGIGAQGYNTTPARRVTTANPDEAALIAFEELFERLTNGMTDAEAATVLNIEQVVTPHGGRIWNAKAVKQARGFIQSRQRTRTADRQFRDSGEAQQLVDYVRSLRDGGRTWPAVLETLADAGYVVPGTKKAWTQHLLKPLLEEFDT